MYGELAEGRNYLFYTGVFVQVGIVTAETATADIPAGSIAAYVPTIAQPLTTDQIAAAAADGSDKAPGWRPFDPTPQFVLPAGSTMAALSDQVAAYFNHGLGVSAVVQDNGQQQGAFASKPAQEGAPPVPQWDDRVTPKADRAVLDAEQVSEQP